MKLSIYEVTDMDKLQKARKRALALAFIFTFILVIGIPAIPVGFVLSGGAEGALRIIWRAVGIIGIVFTAVGFYGCPISWTSYGNYAPLVRVVYAIENESLYSVSEIATYLRKNEKEVGALISKAIDKTYLEGYYFDGKTLTLNKNQKLKKKSIATKCPNCGAPLPPPQDETAAVRCPYCDTVIQ